MDAVDLNFRLAKHQGNVIHMEASDLKYVEKQEETLRCFDGFNDVFNAMLCSSITRFIMIYLVKFEIGSGAPCCSPSGWCGGSPDFCNCPGCQRFLKLEERKNAGSTAMNSDELRSSWCHRFFYDLDMFEKGTT